jgi:hypothetical protein
MPNSRQRMHKQGTRARRGYECEDAGVRLATVSLPFALSEQMRGHQAGYRLDANQ